MCLQLEPCTGTTLPSRLPKRLCAAEEPAAQLTVAVWAEGPGGAEGRCLGYAVEDVMARPGAAGSHWLALLPNETEPRGQPVGPNVAGSFSFFCHMCKWWLSVYFFFVLLKFIGVFDVFLY